MKRYLIEFITTAVTPVTIAARNSQEAIEQALIGKGSVGDTYHLEQDKEVFQVRELDS